MTISQIIKSAADKLIAKEIDNPRLEAEILLAQIIKKPREFILAHGERELTKLQIVNYKLKIKKRLTGLPVAYLTGEKEFYGLKFKVNKNVLVPRPETELMVEEALRITGNEKRLTLVDVGTGSGCIIITLAKLLESRIRNYELWGIDISQKALMVAKQNAQAHGVYKKIKFFKGNLLTPLVHNLKFKIRNSKFIILANLPYGWKQWKNNSSTDAASLKFEPPTALYTGKNGLELYEQLFKQIKMLYAMRCALRDIHLFCEFDPRQTAKIKQLIKHKLPGAGLKIKKDLAGLNRLAVISLLPSQNPAPCNR